jgi:hypothetical protein
MEIEEKGRESAGLESLATRDLPDGRTLKKKKMLSFIAF